MSGNAHERYMEWVVLACLSFVSALPSLIRVLVEMSLRVYVECLSSDGLQRIKSVA